MIIDNLSNLIESVLFESLTRLKTYFGQNEFSIVCHGSFNKQLSVNLTKVCKKIRKKE